jgi:hypothetical protein
MTEKEIEKLKEQVRKEISKVKKEPEDFSVQVTSIHGVKSAIHFQNTEAFVKLKTETPHQTWKAYKGKSKLLKVNRILIELLYVDKFFRVLHDKYGILRVDVSPCALCEIISVLLGQKKRRMLSKDETKVYYLYSNKTLAFAQYFKMLFFGDRDSERSMQMLSDLFKEVAGHSKRQDTLEQGQRERRIVSSLEEATE